MQKTIHNQGENQKIEKVGFYLSVVCAVHCVATPVVITFLPYMGSSLIANHAWELLVIIGSMFLGFWILWNDFQKHKNNLPLILLAGSLITKIFEITYHSTLLENFTAPITAMLIASAYYINWKSKIKCNC